MLYPAYWLVISFVAFALLFWLVLLLWAAHSGLFNKSSESIKHKVFDDKPSPDREGVG